MPIHFYLSGCKGEERAQWVEDKKQQATICAGFAFERSENLGAEPQIPINT